MKDVYYSNTEIDVLDLASSSNLYYSYHRKTTGREFVPAGTLIGKAVKWISYVTESPPVTIIIY